MNQSGITFINLTVVHGFNIYYTKPSLEFEKQFGFMLKPWTTVRFMNVIPDWFIYKIALVGKDDMKYKDGPYDHS
jgi:hypothetical protein